MITLRFTKKYDDGAGTAKCPELGAAAFDDYRSNAERNCKAQVIEYLKEFLAEAVLHQEAFNEDISPEVFKDAKVRPGRCKSGGSQRLQEEK